MYNGGKIITGLVIFVLLVTIPVWYNRGTTARSAPELVMPTNAKSCVLPAEEMRAKHMQLLNVWRDEVVRTGDTTSIVVEGKAYPKSLQLNCMECHTSKVNFCDKCHDYSSVTPYCWDCHIAPVE
ncbi:MAG: sulfate reduction electron transfer complex DsrMKJOP subunit DsrJ [Desulfobulbus sp.]|jgi:hypothetical protein|nr:sulfate reduction electron transfer complex DsrMKJOP subunit DsrJ [Desulfobulbaceae bacterium]